MRGPSQPAKAAATFSQGPKRLRSRKNPAAVNCTGCFCRLVEPRGSSTRFSPIGFSFRYPGLPGWGAKSSAAVLGKFLHIESIPTDCREWRVNAANASALADTLSRERERALLFRTLATLRTDIALFDDVEQLRWNGPTPAFDSLAARLDAALTEKRRPVTSRPASKSTLRPKARR